MHGDLAGRVNGLCIGRSSLVKDDWGGWLSLSGSGACSRHITAHVAHPLVPAVE